MGVKYFDTRGVSDAIRLIFVRNMCISDEDLIKDRQMHLLRVEIFMASFIRLVY